MSRSDTITENRKLETGNSISTFSYFHISTFAIAIAIAIALLFGSCKGDVDVDQLVGRWYITDYPFYQECDNGSWVQLNEDGTCQALILCNNPDKIEEGTWYREDNILYLHCNVWGGFDNECEILSLSDAELKIHTEAYLINFGITVPLNISLSK